MTTNDTGLVDPTSVEQPAAARVERICDICGGFDDHPRHTQWAPGAPEATPSRDVVNSVLATAGDGPHATKVRQILELLTTYDNTTVQVVYGALQQIGNPDPIDQGLIDLFDTSWIMRHLDCCRSAGCPDGSCNAILSEAGDRRGDDLVTFITTNNQTQES